MKRKKGLFLLFIGLFLIVINIVSYGEEFREKSLTKSSKVTWEKAESEIEVKLSDIGSFSNYDYWSAMKDLQYLRYVCLTHLVKYEEYSDFESRFISQVEQSIGVILTEYDEELYNKELKAYKKFEKVEENPNEKVIAKTGFSPDRDILPVKNCGFVDSNKGGLCMGINYYELFYYTDKEKLKTLDFTDMFNSYSSDISNYNNLAKLDKKVDATSDNIMKLTKLSDWEPKNKELRKLVPDGLQSKWESKEKFERNTSVTFANLNKEEKTLYTTLHWLWAWGNNSKNAQSDALKKSGDRDDNITVYPANMLEVIESELKADRPIIVALGAADNYGGHAVLGYKLTQDKKDTKMYYLYVADSNYPGNYYKDGTKLDFKINFYKDTYKGKPAVYFMYAPDREVNPTTSYVFTRTPLLLDSNCLILNTSVKGSTWGNSTTSITLPINTVYGVKLK